MSRGNPKTSYFISHSELVCIIRATLEETSLWRVLATFFRSQEEKRTFHPCLLRKKVDSVTSEDCVRPSCFPEGWLLVPERDEHGEQGRSKMLSMAPSFSQGCFHLPGPALVTCPPSEAGPLLSLRWSLQVTRIPKAGRECSIALS